MRLLSKIEGDRAATGAFGRKGEEIAVQPDARVSVEQSGDEAGAVRSFYNVCRHRAAEVVRTESGNARSFTCFYHHWNYGLDGQLRAVAKPEGYEAVGLDKTKLGLVPVRAELVFGFVFVWLWVGLVPVSLLFGSIWRLVESSGSTAG